MSNSCAGNSIPMTIHSLDIPPVDELRALDDEQFRLIVRNWVQSVYPEHLRFLRKRPQLSENKPWYMLLAKQGWLCPAWPREYGGMGLSAHKQVIMLEEF